VASEKDTVLGRLAVERGYATQQQVNEAFAAQKAAAEAAGVTMPLAQVMVGKEMLTRDQAQELVNAVAVETGEARLVAGYEVISKLGQGGMGAVYKAKHPTSGLYVALKVLPPSLATGELVKRFRREAEIVRKLQHENIVGCVEFGFDKRRKLHFCALELVEGEDLAKRIKRSGKLTEDEAVSIAGQIAMALQHAYANGLVHRDVKPENIMVTADGTAKLLDLGLARPADSEATRMTQSGMFVGSPYYASPEQALAERDIDIRSDIYSLGATLYHMVTGRPPFEGGTALAILQKHVVEKLPWPGEVNSDLSDGLCMIIAKMMQKSPDDRYPTPNDLHGDLDLLGGGKEPEVDAAALKNSSVKVPAVRRKARARMAPGPDRAAARRAPSSRRDSARERRREREPGRQDTGEPRAGMSPAAKIAMGAGVLGLVVVIGLVMFLGGGENDRKPPKPDDSGDTLRAKPGKVTRESVPPDAGRPAVDTRMVSPPAKSAADALREAEQYEKAHPGDLAGGIAKYEAVARDFPGTVESGKAQINIEHVKARIAAATTQLSPQSRQRTPRTAEAGGAAGTSTTTEKTRPTSPPAPSAVKDVGVLLARFDSLMAKGDYAGARKAAEAEVAKPANAAQADALRAAARIARALEERPGAIRRGAESMVGRDVRLKLRTGAASGKLREVTDDGLALVTTYTINRQKRERRADVAWSSLHAEQVNEFAEAGGWKIAAADRAIAAAYAAFAAKDFELAGNALASITERGENPLAQHLVRRTEQAETQTAYNDAMKRARSLVRRWSWKAAVAACGVALRLRPDDPEAAKLLAEAERHTTPAPTLTLDLGGGVRMEMVYIKPGRFRMGLGGGDARERPVHEVEITRGFYIGRYEVTQAQAAAVLGGRAEWAAPNQPAPHVSWLDAMEFCRKASARTRMQVRLPTEAEWEWAARAGSTGKWSFGDDSRLLNDYAWHQGNAGGVAHTVGGKKPNAWGLYDVHGNLYEWVADWFDAGYYARSPARDPTGPEAGTERVLRGGSWFDQAVALSSSFRFRQKPGARNSNLGVRVAVSPPARR